MKHVSRRDFLKLVGAGAAGLLVNPKIGRALNGRSLGFDFASDVVQCYDDSATSGSTINEPVVQVMMGESVKALTGQGSVGEAWKSLFPGITETSVIGIKVNCINSLLATHPAVVRCMTNGLAQMDFSGTPFKKNNIIVWDRTNSELTSSGYTLYTGADPDTVRCFGTNQSGVGYDNNVRFTVNGVTSYPSKIMTQLADYIIDAAVLKTHSQGVVTLNMKNHYGSVNNPGSLQHSSGCSPAVPSLNQQIRDVITPNNIQKVFFIDALFGLYLGGPGGSPNFNPKLLIMSRDIVACDAQGQNVINIERTRRGLSLLNAAQITTATQPPYSLGTNEVNLIEVYNPSAVTEAGPDGFGADDIRVSPQPIRDHAQVAFGLPRAASVRLELTDAAGRRALDVFHGRLAAGRHQVALHVNRRLSAGNYFLRLHARGTTRVRPLTVVN